MAGDITIQKYAAVQIDLHDDGVTVRLFLPGEFPPGSAESVKDGMKAAAGMAVNQLLCQKNGHADPEMTVHGIMCPRCWLVLE